MPLTVDPVCGMQVDPASALSIRYGGETYHFCEYACADTFREDPERWVPETRRSMTDIEAPSAPAASGGTL